MIALLLSLSAASAQDCGRIRLAELTESAEPQIAVLGERPGAQPDVRKAMKVVEATWKISPHPDLADAYAHVRAGDSARDRLKRIAALTRMRAHHPECAFALATVAIVNS